MRLVLLSDTHTFHNQVQVPDGDVLCHIGDMGLRGNISEILPCLEWLNAQPHEHVVAIAGNHDFAFEKWPEIMKESLGRIRYLENTGVRIDGKTFYGSPVTPWFLDWAFNIARGAAIKRYWDEIPKGLDVLLTHGPPHGILDQAAPHKHSECLGCEELFEAVEGKSPVIHAFGHIHGGYGQAQFGSGTKFFNCSAVNEAYKVVNNPWVVDI
jgi:Icc-related predicted phosphoesterase